MDQQINNILQTLQRIETNQQKIVEKINELANAVNDVSAEVKNDHECSPLGCSCHYRFGYVCELELD